jgi:glycosyltransferase involved in cell wall biosynthesis
MAVLMGTEISVVVPVYNEELLIRPFLSEVNRACRATGSSYEMVVVENGSTDNSAKITEELRKRIKAIKMYRLPRPNYGEALRSGVNLARGKFVIIFNVDFWDEKLLRLTTKDMQGYDIIVGSKMLRESMDRRPLPRKIYSWIFNTMLKILFNYPGTETHGIKVLRRKSVQPILKDCKTSSGIMDSELMIRAYREKLKIVEIPVNVAEVRPARFGYKRFIQTPPDIWNLIKSLA